MSTITTWTPGVVLQPADLTPEMVDAIVAALETEHVLALTAWAEARARFEPQRGWVTNPPAAILDILNVIDNRVRDPRWARLGRKGICLQPWAFSCWSRHAGPDNDHDPQHLADNFEALLHEAQQLLAGQLPDQPLMDALAMAHTCVNGGIHDELRNATHYYSLTMPTPPAWTAPPAIMTAERFGQRFFTNVR